jgi:hypothetical protein
VPTAWEEPPGSRRRIEANVQRVRTEIASVAAERRPPTVAQAQQWHRELYDGVPRPSDYYAGEVRDDDRRFPELIVIEEDQRVEGWHRRRLELMPGMTGHWQILGPARVPLQEMVAIDYLYVANWSLWKDVKIMLRTVPYVVGRRGS